MIIVDEHLFLKEITFRELIAPLYLMANATMICISTRSKKSGELREMLERRDKRGRDIVHNFRCSAVCTACQNKGITEECDHEAHKLPPWQSKDKQEQLEVMFEGNKDDHAREILGIDVDCDDVMFPSFLVDELFRAPRHCNEVYTKRIFVAIDPNAGQHITRAKGGSDFALVSIMETTHRTVILGMEAIDAHGPNDYLPALVEHLIALRKIPGMLNATILIAVENDTGHEGGHIHDYVTKRLTKVQFMQETQNKIGTHTNEKVKKDMRSSYATGCRAIASPSRKSSCASRPSPGAKQRC